MKTRIYAVSAVKGLKLFYLQTKSPILGMKWLFKQQDLEMFGIT